MASDKLDIWEPIDSDDEMLIDDEANLSHEAFPTSCLPEVPLHELSSAQLNCLDPFR